MKLAINSLIITSLLACKSVDSIIVGNSSSDSNINEQQQQQQQQQQQETKQNIDRNNLTLSDDSNSSNGNSNYNDKELNSSSTFYYEADAFLLNKPSAPLHQTRGHGQDTSASIINNKTNNATDKRAKSDVIEQLAPPAGINSVSGRSGRMLDLDALVGDLAASRANKQRSQSGDRQSRNLQLPAQLQNLDLGTSGKRLHIQGFIPIIGIKDDTSSSSSSDDSSGDDQKLFSAHAADQLHSLASVTEGSRQRQKSILSHRQLSAPASSLPYGQSSIGHASFNVQRYLNTEQQQQQLDHSNHIGSQQVEPKYSAHYFGPSSSLSLSPTSVVETLKKPIKKLTSTFASAGHLASDKESASGAGLQVNDGAQLMPQQQNCFCVPFYMCKNGYISESSLGRSQMQQLISQQQQLGSVGQQPRQLPLASGDQMMGVQSVAAAMGVNTETAAHALASSLHKGSVTSLPAGSGESYANSFVPVDERSFDREIVTAPPQALGAGFEQTSSNSSSQMSSLSAAADAAAASPMIDTTTINQMSDTEQSNEQPSKSSGGGQQSVASGAAATDMQLSPIGGGTGSGNATGSPDEQQSLGGSSAGQTSDYSQEILGRMLGLKAPSLPFMSGGGGPDRAGGSQQSSAGGVCGLLRTCCNIATNNKFVQMQQQQQQQQTQQLQRFQAAPSNQIQQISRMQLAAPMPPPQQQQQQQQQQLYAPANSHAHQVNHYQAEPMQQQSSALVHRTSTTNQYGPVQRMVPSSGPFGQQLAQYARATPAVQSLQTFQQQPQQQPLSGQVMRTSSSGGGGSGTLNGITTSGANQLQRQQLGTRKLLEGRCGLRQSSGINGRVQNLQYSENAAEFGEYPAQAAILKRLNGSESLFVCSGTLISQSWVATAAHCIRKHLQGELKVRLGEWDVHRDEEFYGYVEKEVRDLVIHPDFVPGNLINDIALIRLDSPVDATLPHINPACLPSLDESFARQRCWVTGWGKDAFGQKGSFQAVLQEVELPVLSNVNCEQALRQTRLGPHYRLHPGFICAGGEGGRDACEGDGGSGLYCIQEGGVIKVAGLVSWGIGCGQTGVPGVYVNLAHYRPWIENIISIDEDIYSSYNSLPFGMPNTLISERSNDPVVNNNNSTLLQQRAETRDNSTRTTTSEQQ